MLNTVHENNRAREATVVAQMTSTAEKNGQVTLPSDLAKAVGIAPGDRVSLQVVGPGTVRLTVLPPVRDTDVPIDSTLYRPELFGPITAPMTEADIPILTLAELFANYRIHDPVDLDADREAIYDEIARAEVGE